MSNAFKSLTAALLFTHVSWACPGSPAWVHASCRVSVSFTADCATVAAEVAARVNGESGWQDPHNGGTYSFLSQESDNFLIQRVTGNGKYTDKLDLTFAAAAAGGCEVEACSESQVTSVLDFSTNYCNLHDLWCGSTDGCKAVHSDLHYSEHVGSCSASDKSQCVAAATAQTASRFGWQQQAEGCEPVSTQPEFDLDTFISGTWYVQQQMATQYLPKQQNYCVSADYRRIKSSFWGYTIQVHNHAEEQDGTVHDSGDFLCAKPDGSTDEAKLQVAPCFLPSVAAGPYWVLSYSEEEGFALVSGGQPTVRTADGCRTGSGTNDAGLWIFTREQQRNEPLVQKARGIAQSKGFDLSVLNDVDQTSC